MPKTKPKIPALAALSCVSGIIVQVRGEKTQALGLELSRGSLLLAAKLFQELSRRGMVKTSILPRSGREYGTLVISGGDKSIRIVGAPEDEDQPWTVIAVEYVSDGTSRSLSRAQREALDASIGGER